MVLHHPEQPCIRPVAALRGRSETRSIDLIGPRDRIGTPPSQRSKEAAQQRGKGVEHVACLPRLGWDRAEVVSVVNSADVDASVREAAPLAPMSGSGVAVWHDRF